VFQYILFNKPYGVLSQFTSEGRWKSLRDFGPFPSSVYAVGRLDADSEGLLLLTDDNDVKHRLTDPRFEHPRTYLVQVEGLPDENRLKRLRHGVRLSGQLTKPAEIRSLFRAPSVPERAIPIRMRRAIPTSWLEITLREGKNRQVRRMTAAVGHPTLRLIRTRMGPLSLGQLDPGKSRILTASEIRELRDLIGLR
jgi:23S rRNA pseudouridine2457 synthase